MDEDIDKIESFTDNQSINFANINCNSCQLVFGIIESYMGVITCPYCGEYVEG